METITLEEGLPGRLLATVDGERHLTDLRHVGELLHAAAAAERLGATALTAWLRQRIAAAEQETRRRGAQPPAGVRRRGGAGAHDPPQQGARVPRRLLPLPVGADLARARAQGAGDLPRPRQRRRADDRRRARRAGVRRARRAVRRRGSAGRTCGSPTSRSRARAPGDRVVGGLVQRARLGALAAAVRARRGRHGRAEGAADAERPRGGDAARTSWPRRRRRGAIGVERSVLEPLRPWAGVARAPAELDAAAFDRELDWRWRRTSFSDITAGAYEARVASEPEEALRLRRARRRRAAAGRRRAPTARRRCAGCRRCWPAWASACASARSCTECSRRPTSRRGT